MKNDQLSQLRVPARYYSRVLALLQQRGVSVLSLALKTRLSPDVLLDSEATVSLAQVESMVAAVEEGMLGVTSTELAYELGQSLKLSSHGILGYGLLSSPNFGYALRLVARYFKLILPMFELRIGHVGDKVEIEIISLYALSQRCLDFHLEAIVFAWHYEVKDLLVDDVPLCSIYISIDPPEKFEFYRKLQGVQLHFSWPPEDTQAFSRHLKMVYPVSVLSRSLQLADPTALDLAEKRCAELLREKGTGGKIVDWVRLSLLAYKDELPTQQALADALNISTRTLDRSLRQEGLNYRNLSNQIRFDRACDALKNPRLSVLEIALELGYRDSSNFTRAFKRISGCSPSQWREDFLASD